jgi:hypothetical protein
VALGDVNGDGALDLLFADHANSQLWLGDGAGGFTFAQWLTGGVNRACFGDLDGDGDLDIFLARYNAGNQVWFNDGTGVFTNSGQSLGSSSTPFGYDYSYALALGDLDGDGDLDAYVGNRYSGIWHPYDRIWLNDGTGFFPEASSIALQRHDQVQDVALGDLDGDGDLDAVVAVSPTLCEVYLNDGSAGLSWFQSFCEPSRQSAVDLADLDGDGDLDAFVTGLFNGAGHRVYTWELLDQRLDLDCDGTADIGPVPDTDGDGLFDDEDNCILVPNPGQEDSDNDGIGDVCDPDNIPQAPVALWRFDESGGLTAVDEALYADGELLGGATRVAGMFGEALETNGSGYMRALSSCPGEIQIGQLSVGLWVEVDYVGDAVNPVIAEIGNGNGFTWKYWFNGTVQLFYGTGTANSAGSVAQADLRDGWHYLVFTYDGQYVRTYVDATLATTTAWYAPVIFDGFHAGAGVGGADPLDGRIDDVAVWNYALDTGEMIWLMANGAPDGSTVDLCPAVDTDNDGVPDEEDNCPDTPNPDQADLDGDGVGDVCDVEEIVLLDDFSADSSGNYVSNELNNGDGVLNEEENCPYDYNPDQLDADLDGVGDMCDDDLDNDGVPDVIDACLPSPPGAVVDESGCSIWDFCPCEHPEYRSRWKNHGAYVRCISRTARRFVREGLITDDEKDAIVAEAAQSDCGRRGHHQHDQDDDDDDDEHEDEDHDCEGHRHHRRGHEHDHEPDD